MKHLIFYLSLVITILFTAPGTAQDYNPQTRVTTYPNGTEYIPSSAKSNHSGSDLVITKEYTSTENGWSTYTEEVIDCNELPDACKQALETEADQAGNSRSSENIKDGCGTLDDWRANPGDWPKFRPIFFPDDKGPGIPMPTRMIGAHTDRIIRQIR